MSKELGTDISRISTLDDVRPAATVSKATSSHLILAVTVWDGGIDEDSWKNAMYAMFGYLCFNNIYNFVPSCTGASRPVVGGGLHRARTPFGGQPTSKASGASPRGLCVCA